MGNAPPTGLAAALTDPAAIRDPYPLYDDLRARAPVHWAGELGAWVLTRYDDAAEVLRDVGAFASDWRRAGEELPPAVRSIQTLDLAEHAVVRRLFADGFRHCDQRRLADRGARRVRDRLATLAGAGPFDFITEVAEPVALATVTDLLGVMPPSLDWFIPLSHTIVDGMDAGLWPQAGPPALAAREELAELIEFWLSRPPRDGLLGYLAAKIDAATGGDPPGGLDHTVAANSVRVLLHAGFESASRLLGTALAALLAEPGGPARFAACDPALATAELIRFATPVQAVGRFCVSARTLGGAPIQPGQEVTVLLGAANRDPVRFTAPARLRLDRDQGRHLGFGRGTHACLGSALAALQTQVVFEALTGYPAARLVSPPVYRRNVTLRGIERLEMSLA